MKQEVHLTESQKLLIMDLIEDLNIEEDPEKRFFCMMAAVCSLLGNIAEHVKSPMMRGMIWNMLSETMSIANTSSTIKREENDKKKS
jgi:hypothetical protein